MATKIIDLIARDIRFPTSRTLAGSDAVNSAPNYSAAYVILKTDRADGLSGHGMNPESLDRYEYPNGEAWQDR